MFRFEPNTSRRGFLRDSVALGAFMLPHVSPALGAVDQRRTQSVIVLLQEGGMSHLETWDPKPQAPAEIRGSFQTIKTTNPALTVGEHMPPPGTAGASLQHRAQRLQWTHARRDHSPGLHWVLTGYDNQAAGVGLMKVNKDPSVGSIVAHELGGLTPAGLPNFRCDPQQSPTGWALELQWSTSFGCGLRCV